MRLTDWIDSIASSKGLSMAQGNALSQGFAVPTTYITGRSIHGGLDIRGALGTPITALVGGTVTLSRLNGGWGEAVIIETTDGHAHWYAHLTTRLVAVGDRVQAGAVIGTLGTTGYSTGPHLHYEVRTKGGRLVDPFTLYDQEQSSEWEPDAEQALAFATLRDRFIYSPSTPATQERHETASILYRLLGSLGALLHAPDAEQQVAFQRMRDVGIYGAKTPKTRERYERAVIMQRLLLETDRRYAKR